MPVGPPPGSGGNVPYPSVAGTKGTIALGTAITAWSTPSGTGTPAMTGGYAELLNDTDSALSVSWDQGSDSITVEPGGRPFLPIPYGVTALNWRVLYQNPYQVHPAQTLSVNLFSPTDLRNGYPGGRTGAINPSTPAAAIGPGNLPAGVLLPAAQVSGGTFAFGVNEPTSNILAGVFSNAVIVDPLLADGSIPSNCKLQSDGTNGNLKVIGGQTTQGRGVPLQVQSKLDQLISATTLTTILTYTPPAGGQFRVSADFTITSASSGITMQVTYTNRTGTATTSFLVSGTTIMNAASIVAGTFPCAAIAFTAQAAIITVSFRDSVLAGTDHVSAYLEWLQ